MVMAGSAPRWRGSRAKVRRVAAAARKSSAHRRRRFTRTKAFKACGSGAGGCLVFLAPPGEEHAVGEALREAGGTVLKFTFDQAGVEAWTCQER